MHVESTKMQTATQYRSAHNGGVNLAQARGLKFGGVNVTVQVQYF